MRPTVAIIDSEANTRQTLRTLLAALDVEVLSFDSAENFLAHTPQAHEPGLACLIVEVSLPGMSGLALLKRLRAANRDLPIVLLAGEADVPMAVEAMRFGATDFIEKPQLDVALLRRVSQVLKHGVAHSA
jgi:FixJ family two-component response regulator